MPNWCNNTARFFNADATKVAGLISELEKGEDAELFNSLHPIPEELRNVTVPNGDASLVEQMQQKYGYADWYDWSVNEWGTKWDGTVYNWEQDENGSVIASFDTAWAPPIALYNKLVAEGWDISATYYEPGMAFVGEYVDGDDECYDYTNADSTTVGEIVPEHLDEEYGISESMREWESLED